MATFLLSTVLFMCSSMDSPPDTPHLWRLLRRNATINKIDDHPNYVGIKSDPSAEINWLTPSEIMSINETIKVIDHRNVIQIPNIRKVKYQRNEPLHWNEIENYENLNEHSWIYVSRRCYIAEICFGCVLLLTSAILFILVNKS